MSSAILALGKQVTGFVWILDLATVWAGPSKLNKSPSILFPASPQTTTRNFRFLLRGSCPAAFTLDACPSSRMILPTMADSNSESKQRQAAQVYAGMTEGELRKLAEEAWSLTEIGKEALKFELSRRGLEIELAKSAA